MLSYEQIILRLALAGLFGAIIGLERERKNWSAGMRTHMMVSVGSCLFMLVSVYGFFEILETPGVTLDPSRVAAGVVSGIGFLGAGTILFMGRGAIRGLTTAAGLWTVSAIGLATGGGMIFAAGTTTIIALFILWVMQPMEKILLKRFRKKALQIVTHSKADSDRILQKLWALEDNSFINFSMDKSSDGFTFRLLFDEVNPEVMEKFIRTLNEDPMIKEIHLTR